MRLRPDKVIAHEQENTQRHQRQGQREEQDIHPDFFIFYSLYVFEENDDSDEDAKQEPGEMEFISVRREKREELSSIGRE